MLQGGELSASHRCGQASLAHGGNDV